MQMKIGTIDENRVVEALMQMRPK